MDLGKMIAELRSELKEMDSAILALERLNLARGKRRGRPSRWAREAIQGAQAPGESRRPGRPKKESQ